jgi:hypothetical protein
VVPAGEPGHLPDVADHHAGDHRADTEDPPGEAGARCLDRRGELGLGLAPLGVQVPKAGQQLGSELPARPGGRARWPELIQDSFGPGCGDLVWDAAGDQAAAPRAAGKRPGCGPGTGHDGVWPRPSAPRRGPQRSLGAGPWTAAPRPRPTARHSGRSY